jgi:hypothetical protein
MLFEKKVREQPIQMPTSDLSKRSINFCGFTPFKRISGFGVVAIVFMVKKREAAIRDLSFKLTQEVLTFRNLHFYKRFYHHYTGVI